MSFKFYMLLPQDIATTFSVRNIVLSCIIFQGKVKTQSLCIIYGFKKQKRHESQFSLSLAPFGFHICYGFDLNYLKTTKFGLM